MFMIWIIYKEKIVLIVIDISRIYFRDLTNQKYGTFVSYEQSFNNNVGDILTEILLRNNQEKYFAYASYKYILKRYLRFYDIAMARGEQNLLLDEKQFLNQIVRAMNKKMVEKYIFELSFLERQHLETIEELTEKAKLFPSLSKFVQIVKHILYEQQDVIDENVGQLLGNGLGLESNILTRTREYYAQKDYMDEQGINLSNLKEFYEAMKADRLGEYDKAIEWVNQAIKKYDAKIKPYKTMFASKEEFANAAAYYTCTCAVSSVDVWGHFITKYIASKDNPYCRVENMIQKVNFTEQEKAEKVYKKLSRSDAKWLMFDIYFIVQNTETMKSMTQEALKAAFDKFILFAKNRYGTHIIMHKLQIKTSYVEEHGNAVEFNNAEKLKQDEELLEKWQNYVIQNLPCHVIDSAGQYVLKQDTCIVNDGIDYGWDYLEDVMKNYWELVKQEINPMKIDNYLDAAVKFSLGNDFIIAMLAGRYKKTNFTVFAYNEYMARAFREYKNLRILTDVSLSGIKKCKNMMVLESRTLEKEKTGIEGRWKKEMTKKAKKLYSLKADLIYSVDIVNTTNQIKGEGAVIFARNFKNIPDLLPYEEKYIMDLINLCKEFAQEKTKVCLMSTGDNDRDGKVAEEIIKQLEPEAREYVQTYCYQGNMEEAVEIMQNAEYIVGSGFYEIALGFLMEKTVYPIVYSEKAEQMLSDSSFQGKYCDVRSNDSISLEDIKSNTGYKVQTEKLTEDAQKQLAVLDKIFI